MYSGLFPFSRASFIFDFIIIAMSGLIPVVIWSIIQARRGFFVRHIRTQKCVTAVLFVTVLLFEVDMRIWGWRHLAEVSPYYNSWVFPVLYIHLICSISTVILWVLTLWRARKMSPLDFPETHRGLARSAFAGLCLTTMTGIGFYYLAFVA